jgi:Flp pilus assembly protein TadG
MSRNQLGRRDDRGVVAIELVLVAPFLMALVFAIASFGSWFAKKNEVTGNAREVARALALRDSSWMSKVTPGSVVQSSTACVANNTTGDAVVTLKFDGDALVSIPGIPLNPPDITVTARFRCAGNP